MYELGPAHLLRAGGTALAGGVALGLIGALLFPPSGRGAFFFLFIALLVGSGAGALLAQGIDRATGGKRGMPVQAIAVGGVLLAGVVRLAIHGAFDEIGSDLAGIVMVTMAAVAAWGRLR